MSWRCKDKNLSNEGLMSAISKTGRNDMEKGCCIYEKESQVSRKWF